LRRLVIDGVAEILCLEWPGGEGGVGSLVRLRHVGLDHGIVLLVEDIVEVVRWLRVLKENKKHVSKPVFVWTCT
jgi:hypothetical protein